MIVTPLGENKNHVNERKHERKQSALGGLVKGVVEWLSPKKSRPVQQTAREDKGKENTSRRRERFSFSEDEENDDNIANTSSESNLTLIASTPTKEKEVISEPKTGIDLLLQFCERDHVVDFTEFMDELLKAADIKKLGEASYSEVFMLTRNNGSKSVLKIVPFNEKLDEKQSSSLSKLDDILQELRISKAMTKIDGFADFKGYSPS